VRIFERPNHPCALPIGTAAPGTKWTCPSCRARYRLDGASWTQIRKPRRPIWSLIGLIADALTSLP
jgi:hypothetical protein